jgi:hypothetical protein
VEPAHDAAAQVTPCAYFRQAPAPSQAPSRPHVATPSSGHSLRGSVPTSAGVHIPRLPTAAQVMHVPAHAELQHTPSTQNPLPHIVPAVHDAPLTNPAGGVSDEESTASTGASGAGPSAEGPPSVVGVPPLSTVARKCSG